LRFVAIVRHEKARGGGRAGVGSDGSRQPADENGMRAYVVDDFLRNSGHPTGKWKVPRGFPLRLSADRAAALDLIDSRKIGS